MDTLMVKSLPKLVVFDCDGTLTDSHHTIVEAMGRTFDKLGQTAPDDMAVRQVIGLSLPQAIAQLAPEASEQILDQLVATYRTVYRNMRLAGEIREALYPGVRKVLDRLSQDGVLLAVATGKSKVGLDHVLEVHALSGYFISLQTADMHPSKPHPQMLETAMSDAGAEPLETVMIGDSPYDILMGNNARTRSLGVRWTDHGVEELERAGADGLIGSYDDLPELLSTWTWQ